MRLKFKRGLKLHSQIVIHIINPVFIPYKAFFSFSIGWGVSIIFWINPLVLVSIFEVTSDFIGGLDEVFILLIVSWIVIQILFSNGEWFELVNSIVVVSNLWESEGLFVNINRVNLHSWFFEARCLDLFFKLHGSFKMFLVQRYWELLQFLVHFVQLLLMLFFFLFLLFSSFFSSFFFLLFFSFCFSLGFSSFFIGLSFSFGFSSLLFGLSFSFGLSSLLFSFGISFFLSLSSFINLAGLFSFLLWKALMLVSFFKELRFLLF